MYSELSVSDASPNVWEELRSKGCSDLVIYKSKSEVALLVLPPAPKGERISLGLKIALMLLAL